LCFAKEDEEDSGEPINPFAEHGVRRECPLVPTKASRWDAGFKIDIPGLRRNLKILFNNHWIGIPHQSMIPISMMKILWRLSSNIKLSLAKGSLTLYLSTKSLLVKGLLISLGRVLGGPRLSQKWHFSPSRQF
jgi:hypothetical protein